MDIIMNKIELLAPAGNMDSLTAAVESGADAVYIGGKGFSARQYAGNFDDDEMVRAIDYCHIRGVKVYVTVNILLKDRELYGLPKVVRDLYSAGADALIIQDLGAGELIKNILPDFELHASTQMTAHNLEAVNLLYEMGYKRVVLSRELSLREIEHICSNTKAEIEVFTHGALCICYSGQCLMSSMIGGRSGNRGRCAQPCRQKYELYSGEKSVDEGYLLSPKDLNTIDLIDHLYKSGVKSLKIEGRMKSPEYVACVTSVYRKAVDSLMSADNPIVTDEDRENLLKVFNRGGFTTAHLLEKGRSGMMSFERPKNWGIYIGDITKVYPKRGKIETFLKSSLSVGDGIEIWLNGGENIGYYINSIISNGESKDMGYPNDKILIDFKGGAVGDRIYKTFDKKLNKSLGNMYKSAGPIKKIPLKCHAAIKKNRPVELNLYDYDGNIAEVKGSVPEVAERVDINEDKLIEQLSKLGGTPFYVEEISVDLDSGLSVPLSRINQLRREAVDKIINDRVEKSKPGAVSSEAELQSRVNVLISNKALQKNKKIKINVGVRNFQQTAGAVNGGANTILLGGDAFRGQGMDFNKAIKLCRENGVSVYMSSFRIIKGEFRRIAGLLQEGIHSGAEGVYVQNMGILNMVKQKGIPFAAGYHMNVFNYVSAKLLADLGCSFISVSPELTLKEIKDIAPYIENCEALCYGRIEMMVSEYCPIGREGKHCTGGKETAVPCRGQDFYLRDRMGMEFPVKTDMYCRSHIFNSKVLSMLESIGDIIDSGVNILHLEMLNETQNDTERIVKAFKDGAASVIEGGNMDSNTIDVIETIKNMGYTKGHYYRGVE
jgi:Collagenase and related proteases